MRNGNKNILEKICVLTQSNLGYVLSSGVKKQSIIHTWGTITAADKNYGALNKLIARDKEETISTIKQSKAFKSIHEKTGYKSFYKEKFFEDGETNYYLVLFSAEKLADAKTLRSNIASLIDDLKTELKSPVKKDSPHFSSNLFQSTESDLTIKETINNINIVLYSTNAAGSEFNFITEAVRTLFGYAPEDIYKNKFHVLKSIYPAYFSLFKDFIGKLRNKEDAVVEYRMKDRFGKEHWVRHSGVPIIKNGEVTRIVGVIEEITEEKNVLLRLERSEERFRILIDTADDLIFILDGFGYFSMVNKNGANALGYTPDEMLGRHFLEFIDKEDESKVAHAFNTILSSSGVTTFEMAFIDRFDKTITFEVSAKPMITDGVVSGMLSIGRNVSARKLDEQKIKDLNAKLIEANRIISIERERARHKITVLEELNKLKSEFISNVSHELRTPLASIVGFAETIISDTDLPNETVHEFSNIILTEGKRLGKLINDLLDFSKLESGEEELQKITLSIIEVLEDVCKNFIDQIKEKNLVLSKDFPKEDIIIKADKERITKVFTNLISNAIKFTDNGGRISLLVQDFGKEIEVAVSDTGIGIPEKNLSGLFQKFNKVQRPGAQIGGTGFGLVTVKQIVDLHKGFIKVRSEVDKGTTFIIRLPK